MYQNQKITDLTKFVAHWGVQIYTAVFCQDNADFAVGLKKSFMLHVEEDFPQYPNVTIWNAAVREAKATAAAQIDSDIKSLMEEIA